MLQQVQRYFGFLDSSTFYLIQDFLDDSICGSFCENIQKFYKNDSVTIFECDICQNIISSILNKLNDDGTPDLIENVGEKLCGVVFESDWESICIDFVYNHIDDIMGLVYNMINQLDISPENTCKQMGYCDDVFIQKTDCEF